MASGRAKADRACDGSLPYSATGQVADPLVQASLFTFRDQLFRAFRRSHLPPMFEDEGVNVLAAHHTTPPQLIDLTELLWHHEPSATEASVPCDLCGWCHHIVLAFLLKVVNSPPAHSSAGMRKGFTRGRVEGHSPTPMNHATTFAAASTDSMLHNCLADRVASRR